VGGGKASLGGSEFKQNLVSMKGLNRRVGEEKRRGEQTYQLRKKGEKEARGDPKPKMASFLVGGRKIIGGKNKPTVLPL